MANWWSRALTATPIARNFTTKGRRKTILGKSMNAMSDYFRGPSRAANRQADAAEKGIAAQAEKDAAALETQKPWLEVGEKHLRSLSDMVSGGEFNVDPGQFRHDPFQFNFQADPGYQFALDQGRQAIDASAASRGGLRSGATLKALSDYGQGMANQEYGNVFNRQYGQYTDNYNRQYGQFHDDFNRRMTGKTNQYNQMANMAGIGQTAANNVSSMNMQQGQNLYAGHNNLGNARANQAMSMQNMLNPLINAGAQGLGAYYGGRAG